MRFGELSLEWASVLRASAGDARSGQGHDDLWSLLPVGIVLVFTLLIMLGMTVLWIYSCVWIVNDAEQRGRSGCLIGLLVFMTWPLGLLVWIAARPDISTSRPPPVPNASLSPGEWIGFSALFLLIPVACVLVSSILYYVWRGTQPRKAVQINRLGWGIFLAEVLLLVVGAMTGSPPQ